MARAPTTLDPFNAVAEPKRRQMLDVLAGGEMQVNGIVTTLGWPQPVVSKHRGLCARCVASGSAGLHPSLPLP